MTPKASREDGKDPKKVASGIKGRAKGGHARAKNLSAKKLRAIGKKGAKARWTRKTA